MITDRKERVRKERVLNKRVLNKRVLSKRVRVRPRDRSSTSSIKR